MGDFSLLSSELNHISQGSICLVEVKGREGLQEAHSAVKLLQQMRCKGIIFSSEKPYHEVLDLHRGLDINPRWNVILDCVTRGLEKRPAPVQNVVYINPSTTLDAWMGHIGQCLELMQGKKFVFVDSVNTLVERHGEEQATHFLKNLLGRMKALRTGGVMAGYGISPSVRETLSPYCDRVIYF